MKGIGYQTQEQALAQLSDMTTDITPIEEAEYRARIAKAQAYMQAHQIDAVYLNAGTNMTYFTGLKWYASERLVGALLPAQGDIAFVAPFFEIGSLRDYQVIDAPIHAWQEEENPYELVREVMTQLGYGNTATLAIDESAQFFIADGIKKAAPNYTLINGGEVTKHCRMHKSNNELALIQRAMDMTLEVHKAAASILHEGITTREVEAFINAAHKKVGAVAGNISASCYSARPPASPMA